MSSYGFNRRASRHCQICFENGFSERTYGCHNTRNCRFDGGMGRGGIGGGNMGSWVHQAQQGNRGGRGGGRGGGQKRRVKEDDDDDEPCNKTCSRHCPGAKLTLKKLKGIFQEQMKKDEEEKKMMREKITELEAKAGSEPSKTPIAGQVSSHVASTSGIGNISNEMLQAEMEKRGLVETMGDMNVEGS